ncbi:serine/threonine protein kinase [Yersinia alsatica]|uniref:Vgb family protein n=1 Tax=Yersinia alsatica TaxID=2890317 RepID=UPI001F27A67D|nr:serine/threonine protein kinase [Yersinia alsatica]
MKTGLYSLILGCNTLLLPLAFPSISLAQPIAAENISQWQGFNAPTGIATAKDGTVYVTNWGGNTVDRIAPDGSRSVFLTGISSPAGIVIDNDGTLFVASYSGDYIEAIAPDGARKRLVEGLATPTGLALAANGQLLVANRAAGQILSINKSNGQQRVVARSLSLPVGVVEMKDGSLVSSQYGGRVTRIKPDGTTQELGKDFTRPGVGILADGDDAVFVIDNGANVVRRVSFSGQTQTIGPEMTGGSAVALGWGNSNELLAGAWGSNRIYRIQLTR